MKGRVRGGEARGDRRKVQGLEGHSGAHRLPLAAAGATDSGTGVGTIEREEVQRSSLADVGGILLPRT